MNVNYDGFAEGKDSILGGFVCFFFFFRGGVECCV